MCGFCCRHYDIVLGLPEWIDIVKNFGVEYTKPSITKFSLKRRTDGSCTFLYKTSNASFCGLQYMKPQACKLWPFKVSNKPKFGNADNAAYYYMNRKFFVYADTACTGLKLGVPTQDFVYSIIPEFIGIALGVRQKQLKTTAIL